MYSRPIKLSTKSSFFLFGAHGTGKTTLLKQQCSKETNFYIDLLNEDWLSKLSLRPQMLAEIISSLPETITHIIIDEIQKIPEFLNVVHHLIESQSKKFILTGSSAKKLKKGGANLLAGRAFVYSLFPLTFLELGIDFNLMHVLQYGSLPSIFHLESKEEIFSYLSAYAQTYLKEEIWNEQIVRKLNPFRKFLEVAAQSNTKIITISNIARDVGVDDKTVSAYYKILEDTLLGFHLEPFHHSFRKQLSSKPKFYFFDTGVVRTLTNQLPVLLVEQTSGFGEAFEHYIICEIYRLKHYKETFFKLSYLRTQSDREIDVVIERPGLPLLLIEIKSSTHVDERTISSLRRLKENFNEPCEAIVLSRETIARTVDSIKIYPLQEGLRTIFNL